MWITIRGFSMASSWLEEYKKVKKTKVAKKKKACEKTFIKECREENKHKQTMEMKNVKMTMKMRLLSHESFIETYFFLHVYLFLFGSGVLSMSFVII